MKRTNKDLFFDIVCLRKANKKYEEHDEIGAGSGEIVLGVIFWVVVIMFIFFTTL
jgi:hypothetical protein